MAVEIPQLSQQQADRILSGYQQELDNEARERRGAGVKRAANLLTLPPTKRIEAARKILEIIAAEGGDIRCFFNQG